MAVVVQVRVGAQHAQPGAVVDGGELVVLVAAAAASAGAGDGFDELDVDLHPMCRAAPMPDKSLIVDVTKIGENFLYGFKAAHGGAARAAGPYRAYGPPPTPLLRGGVVGSSPPD